MKNLHIVAKLDGVVVGTEDISFGETFQEIIDDKRFKDTEKYQWTLSAFVIDRQKDLRDGGLTPDEKKIVRLQRAREALAKDLGYASFDELKIAVAESKETSVPIPTEETSI